MRVIGRAEQVDFPFHHLRKINAKVDTGADSSSIHATRIRVKKEDDEEVLYAWLAGAGPFRFEEFRKKKVTSSNGSSEVRYAVKLTVRVGGKNYKTTFTLTNRNRMTYPILLGKKFLRGKFVVDVAQKNIYQKKDS